jgi:hypothetical protein
LQFYFKYIAGIDEADEPEETIDASTLGSVIHDVLAQLFDPFKDRKLSPEDIQKMKSKSEPLIRGSFEKNYANGDIDFGKNLLIVKVANQYIHHFLEHEAAECKLHINEGGYVMIREIEKSFSATVPIDTHKYRVDVKLTGRFDRIDDHAGSIRIIDYKTGKVEPNELKFKSWDELSTDSKLDKCFQLLFYAFLYSHPGYNVIQPILPGIISFRNLSQGLMEVKLPEDEHVGTESLRKFGSILKSILSEIFNPEIPFSQTDIADNCKYCAFASICNRN